MSKYSLIWKGQVLDYRFMQSEEQPFIWFFWCGDIFMGQLFNMGKTGWSAVPNEPHELSPFDGFKTRLDAAEMCLKVNGFRRKEL